MEHKFSEQKTSCFPLQKMLIMFQLLFVLFLSLQLLKYVPDYLVRSSANGQNEEDLKGEKEDVKRQSENDNVENDEMVSN
ncbi:hypothetical protein RFI_39770 [Reticulomyxa filosa]|uniref:Transmembrane protein n=1 Tax=Reticulomyxa filosa TaxID=46433 RepID=X6L9E6_RETFI|nr:hypothetical protein RFI_39770 [Reticulomyxa filosa]|eukprot:ETN97756.1 hypothetical protein RFI_39770 [Reticulomyxa filosa]